MSDRQLCRATKLHDKVAQLCCVSDMGLRLTQWLDMSCEQ